MKEITFSELKKLIKESISERFYIVVERDNPQLGTYLNDVYVGKAREKSDYILCSFDYYGSRKSLKFSISKNSDGSHWCINPGNSVYGSMNYYGFDSAEDAKMYLEKNWSDHYNFKKCMDKLI